MTEHAGAAIRTDIVEVYIVMRRSFGRVSILQLQRAEEPMQGSWQPIMGHIEAGESAVRAAAREVLEEVGLDVAAPECVEFLALQGVHPYFAASMDAIVMSPRFCVMVDVAWIPMLNSESSAYRWVGWGAAGAKFLWPGQRETCTEIAVLVSQMPHPAMKPALDAMRIDRHTI